VKVMEKPNRMKASTADGFGSSPGLARSARVHLLGEESNDPLKGFLCSCSCGVMDGKRKVFLAKDAEGELPEFYL
jgi:hypothetical protein